MSNDWSDTERMAREELRDRFKNYREEFYDGEPHDVIHEIADGMVPVYTMDRFALLADPAVGMHEISDLGILPKDGELADLVGVYIYDALSEALWDEWREMEADDEDEDE